MWLGVKNCGEGYTFYVRALQNAVVGKFEQNYSFLLTLPIGYLVMFRSLDI